MATLETWLQGAAFAATGGVVLKTYAETLFASVPGGDSGELLAEACRLGHAHPPGYPLFTLVYHAFVTRFQAAWVVGDALLPPAEEALRTAWKANLLTAFFGAMAAAFLQASTLALSPGSRVAAAGASAGLAVAFALSPLTWLYSIGAEVFALNNMLCAVLVWLVVQYGRSGRDSAARELWVCVGAFWCGLALCNQHTAVLFEIPLISWVLLVELRAGRLGAWRLSRWAALFIAGLLPYAYLPWTLTVNRQQGSWGDTTTLHGFVHHLRRGDYGTFKLYSGTGKTTGALERIALYAHDLTANQGAWVVPALALVAMARSAAASRRARSASGGAGTTEKTKLKPAGKRGKQTKGKQGKKKVEPGSPVDDPLGKGGSEPPAANASPQEATADRHEILRALLAAWAFYVVVFHLLSNMPLDEELLFGVQARFWMQPNLIAFLMAGVGLAELGEAAAPALGRVAPAVAVVGAASLLAAYQAETNRAKADQSENAYMERYARGLLAAMPAKSLLIVTYDQHWTALRYLQQCLGERPDVTIVDGPMLSYAWAQHYRETYHEDPNKCIVFPGTHWVRAGTAEHAAGGFSTLDLFRANFDACPGGVFWAGTLPFATDTSFNTTFTSANVGLFNMVLRIDPRKALGPGEDTADFGIKQMGFQTWLGRTAGAWNMVDAAFLGGKDAFPPREKYGMDTWEATLAIDYFEHLCADAASILSAGVERDELTLMAMAAYMLERANRVRGEDLAAASLKNLGLAYVKMVQSKQSVFNDVPGIPPELPAALFGLDPASQDWRGAAGLRAYEHWSRFLEHPSANKDPSFESVKSIVAVLKAAVHKKHTAAAAAADAAAAGAATP